MPFLKVSSIWYLVSGIRNFKYTKYKILNTKSCKSFGFTLIEFLVVLGLLTVTVSTTLLFLSSILRGSNKANVTAEVKQNGQAVLDSLERQIRNAVDAEQIEASPEDKSHIKLLRPNGDPLHIRCFQGTLSTSNDWIGVATTTEANPGDNLYIHITNIDPVSGVSADYDKCSLKVIRATEGATSPAVVSVSFVLNQGVQAPSRQDFKANAQFATTISLRKY